LKNWRRILSAPGSDGLWSLHTAKKDFGIALELARPIDESAKIHIYQNRIGRETRRVFEVKDCYKSYELLSKRGVKFLEKPAEQPWGVKAQFEDLYGNVFVVWSPRRTPSH
jgi:Txe/YoeB family toxin of Txe-Axe toxin-antitoxin module